MESKPGRVREPPAKRVGRLRLCFEYTALRIMSKFVNGYFQVDGKDIDRAIRATGAVHHYIFGGFDHIYTSVPLTEEEQKQYEERAQESLAQCASEISKAIDYEILKHIRSEYIVGE